MVDIKIAHVRLSTARGPRLQLRAFHEGDSYMTLEAVKAHRLCFSYRTHAQASITGCGDEFVVIQYGISDLPEAELRVVQASAIPLHLTSERPGANGLLRRHSLS